MDAFDSAIALIGDEYRDEADAVVLDREARRSRCLHDGPPVTERIRHHERGMVTLRCTVPHCGREQLFSEEILQRLVEPEMRRIALKRSRLARTFRNQGIVARQAQG
jgi:hypothetical protein